MKETRPVQKKTGLIIRLLIIVGFLTGVYLFWTAHTDLPQETGPVGFWEKLKPGKSKTSTGLTEQTDPAADKKPPVAGQTGPFEDFSATAHKTPLADPDNGLTAPDRSRTAQDPAAHSGESRSRVVQKSIQRKLVINYPDLKTGSPIDQVMEKRLQAAGITKSLDLIVRSDESFTVGGKTVSMTDILEKAYAEKQKIFEKRITEFEQTEPETQNEYGIYVVMPGDNIWNIHFNILRETYASRGIHVAPDADEPLDTGHSSGVGKVLKFSEIMVIIYSLIEENVVMDIDLIEPMSKIVIYNMGDVFSLLSDIRFDQIDQIQFDGRTIWIPGRET
jgi:hypothetical protein